MNLMVQIGHFPSWPLIEIRSPCISSSPTLSTVPAFPSERITALPTSSFWACSYSPRIVDARSFTVGIGDPEPEFERGAMFAFEGGQVVTRVRQTGVNGTRADNGTDA